MRFILAVFLLAATAGTAQAHLPDGSPDSMLSLSHQFLSPHHLTGIVVVLLLVVFLALSVRRSTRDR